MTDKIINIDERLKKERFILEQIRSARHAVFEGNFHKQIKDSELNLVKKELFDFFDSLPRLFGDTEHIYRKIDLRVLFAKKIHEGQVRKFEENEDGEKKPYLAHLLRVASSVADYLFVFYGGKAKDEEFALDIVSAALLHDSVEDRFKELYPDESADYKVMRVKALSAIENKFGQRVRHYLNILSSPVWEGKDMDKYHSWVKHIWEDKDPISSILKFSDMKDNLRGLDSLYGLILHANYEGYADVVIKFEKLFKKYVIAILMFREILLKEITDNKNLQRKLLQDVDILLNDAFLLTGFDKSPQEAKIDDIVNFNIIGD